MPRGGRRAGAGRKPAAWKMPDVLGKAPRHGGEVLPPAVPEEAKDELRAAPDGLTAGARTYWVRWADQALVERTLTPATAAGFVELCQRADYVGQLAARIALLGPATQDALPYLSLYDRMSKSLESSLARFKLTAFGKPATSDKPQPAANPWAQVAAK